MLRALWRELPAIVRFGLIVAVSGVALDFVHHGFTHNVRAMQGLGIGVAGHLLTTAGMVVALSGVIRAVADSRRRARQKGESDAARSSAAASR